MCACGTVFDFYQMDYGEIIESIEASQERERQSLQMHASIAYRQAYLNSFAFNAPSDMPAMDKAFHGLFDNTEGEFDVEAVTEASKQNLLLYALEHNSRFNKKQQKGDGDST